MILTVDVQPLGQNGTSIGFAAFNCWFHHFTGVNMVIYTITDWMGLVPVAICLSFAGIGLVQLMKRRSLFRVDADIMILGVYFVIVFLAYAILEMIPINYRPILIEGRMEASYPSSTTLLVLSVMPALIEQIQRRLSGITAKRIIMIVAIAFSAFMVIGRLVSRTAISKWESGVVLHEIIDKFIITIVPLLFNAGCKEVVKDTRKMVYFPDSDKSTVRFFLRS